jgi:hypothetical protein
MAKHTTRDRIWHAALELAREREDETSPYRRRFEIGEVERRLDDNLSRRTVRDTLATMADLGDLERGRKRGTYEPPGDPLGERADHAGDPTSLSGASSSPPREDVDATEDMFREDDVVDDKDDDPVATADLQEPSVGLEQGVDGIPGAVEARILAFDPPGDRDEERRDAIRAAYRYLQTEGSARTQDFLKDVFPEHSVGYETATRKGGWWRRLVKPGLEEFPDVVKPAGGQPWRLEDA